MLNRRQFSVAATQLAAAAFASNAHAAQRCVSCNQFDDALTSAANYLAAKQAPDGVWRSEVYGPLKDGPSLTALIASTLKHVKNEPGQESFRKAAEFLLGLVEPRGTINPRSSSITYPVYAAAGAAIALSDSGQPKHTLARDAWLAYLRNLQLTDSLGWQTDNLAYGGWSYASAAPSPVEGKPPTPLAVPNLSATVFALDALRAAGCRCDDPAILAAGTFVKRCQNWHDDPVARDPLFDDGGFFFILEDPIRNKAGEAGSDASGHQRFTSYGSATADGLRALLACGYAPHHPRVIAARNWLIKHFSAEEHPGAYASHRAHARPAVYYYYTASIAQALRQSDLPTNCAKDLAEALIACQRNDGSWANPVVDTREDDPLVATPLAMRGLISCQLVLAEPE